MELAAIADRNPEFQIHDYLVLDVLIGHAVRILWLNQHPDHQDQYAEHKAEAWQYFYGRSPFECASYFVKALKFLTEYVAV